MKHASRVAGLIVLLGICFGFSGVSLPVLRAEPKPRPEPAAVVLRGTDDAGGFLALRVPTNVFAQLQQAGAGTNMNLSQVGGTSVAGTLYDTANTALKVNCVVGCTASAGFTDNTAFTAGATAISNIGGVFNDALAALLSGNAAAARITAQRGLHINLRNNAGTEIGTVTTPVRTDPTGTTTQPVSGTVTANVGTTGGLALDASVTGISLAQGAATAGQRALLVEGAVTTAAPAYTTGNSNPLSLNTAGGLRVDGSGVTQPVSGTVSTTPPANASTNLTQLNGVALGSPAAYGTSPGAVNVPGVNAFVTNTPNVNIQANASVNEAQIGGVNVVSDPCQRAARTSVNINLTASTQLIAGVAAQQIYICSMNLIVGAADNVALVEGTGVTCATATAGMAGGATAATGWNLAANGGFVNGTGTAWVFRTATAADNVCLLVSGTAQVSGNLSYVQF